MAFRPNGVPVTGVPGMPQMVGFNQTIVGQPMTMVPMMQPTMIGVPVRNVPQMVQVRASPLGPQIIGQAIQQSDGPPVTVFVGNISEKATDTLVRQILMKCGTVNNWKRVQGEFKTKLDRPFWSEFHCETHKLKFSTENHTHCRINSMQSI